MLRRIIWNHFCISKAQNDAKSLVIAKYYHKEIENKT